MGGGKYLNINYIVHNTRFAIGWPLIISGKSKGYVKKKQVKFIMRTGLSVWMALGFWHLAFSNQFGI